MRKKPPESTRDPERGDGDDGRRGEGEQLDPETERLLRIQEQLREAGSTEVQIRVWRLAPGKGKVYLDTLRVNSEAASDYQEAVTNSFGGSGEGSYFVEFRVSGRILGSASFVADGEPFHAKRTPPAPLTPPTAPVTPSVAATSSAEKKLRMKLRRALRRRRRTERVLQEQLDELRERLETRPAEAPRTSLVDDAIKLMEARAPKVDSPVHQQLADIQKRLDDSERARQEDKVERVEKGLGRELRILRKKLRRATAKPSEKGEDPFKEYLRFKTDLEKAKVAGADTGFVDKLSKRLDDKYGDRLLEFLDAKVADVIPTNGAAPSSTPSADGKSPPPAESVDAFRDWIAAQFKAGLAFVDNPKEVLEATQKFPQNMTKLAQITTRAAMIDFVATLGFPKFMVERQLTEDKAPAYMQLLEKLRTTLQTLAAQASAPAAAPSAPAPAAPPAAATPAPATPPTPTPSPAIAAAPASLTTEKEAA